MICKRRQPLTAGICARPHIHLLSWSSGRDVKVEDIHRQTHRGTRVGDLNNHQCALVERKSIKSSYIYNSCYMTLYRGTGKQKIYLIIIITCGYSISKFYKRVLAETYHISLSIQ